MWDLDANMRILYGPQGPSICILLYVYAFRANAHIEHGMMCYCIDIKHMWYGESFILNLFSSFYYAC